MSTEALTEEGYQAVAGRKNNDDMREFIKRVISEIGMKLKEEDPLHGFVPYYSGETSVQSLERMKTDVRGQSWCEVAVDGNSAALTEDGYQTLAVLKSNDEMLKYANRLMADKGMSCDDQAKLAGLLHFYSGAENVQSVARLLEELNAADWIKKPAAAAPAAAPAATGQSSWNDDADCDGSKAGERAKWLMDNQGKSQEEARQQVRTEYPQCFGGSGGAGGAGGKAGASQKFGEKLSAVPFPDGKKHKLRIEIRPTDGQGISLVAVHYSINGSEDQNFDIANIDGSTNAWVHETPQGGYPDCPPGSTIKYWLFMVRNGVGEQEPADATSPAASRLTVTI